MLSIRRTRSSKSMWLRNAATLWMLDSWIGELEKHRDSSFKNGVTVVGRASRDGTPLSDASMYISNSNSRGQARTNGINVSSVAALSGGWVYAHVIDNVSMFGNADANRSKSRSDIDMGICAFILRDVIDVYLQIENRSSEWTRGELTPPYGCR